MTAWTIQALRDDFEITLATLGSVDWATVNRSFGTSLVDSDVDVRIAPLRYRGLIRLLPTRGALLECQLTSAWARELDGRRRFDTLLSLQNEADFGRPAIQYIHYPCWYLPRPAFELRWYHRIPGLLGLYRGLSVRCSGATVEGWRRNLSIANSRFVAGRTGAVHGGRPVVIHPPVPGGPPAAEWESRRGSFVAVGRFSSYKRWPMAVSIIDSVRARGHDIGLTLIGQIGGPGDLAEKSRLERMAASRPWFRILTDLPRAQLLAELAAHRYGIHTMEEEHFGIAPAELQRAGCITFVHNSGGPVEIVGGDPRLTFDTAEEAARKIAHVLDNPGEEQSLRASVESRYDWFSTERFCAAIRSAVIQTALPDGNGP